MRPQSIPGALKDLVDHMLCDYTALLHLRANICMKTALLCVEKTRKPGLLMQLSEAEGTWRQSIRQAGD